MDIIERSVDARMTSVIESPAFILSLFTEILKNMYTIWSLKILIYIVSIYIERKSDIFSTSHHCTSVLGS